MKSIKQYAKKLTEEKSSELFSFDLYKFMFLLLEKESETEVIRRKGKHLSTHDKIDFIL